MHVQHLAERNKQDHTFFSILSNFCFALKSTQHVLRNKIYTMVFSARRPNPFAILGIFEDKKENA